MQLNHYSTLFAITAVAASAADRTRIATEPSDHGPTTYMVSGAAAADEVYAVAGSSNSAQKFSTTG